MNYYDETNIRQFTVYFPLPGTLEFFQKSKLASEEARFW